MIVLASVLVLCSFVYIYEEEKKKEHLYSASNVTPSVLNVVLGIVGSKINCHTVTYRSQSVKNVHGTGISILPTQFANLVKGAFFLFTTFNENYGGGEL